MYTYIHIIFGIPLSEKGGEKIVEWEGENNPLFSEYDDEFDTIVCGFTTLHHGGADNYVGYCGIEIAKFNECEDCVPYSLFEPTMEQINEVFRLCERIPQELRALCPEIGMYYIFSTS